VAPSARRLFAATDEAGIPDGVATQLAEIFANDIDFRRELKRGASFSVVYEALSADGEPITWGPLTGRVLAAEFVNKGQTFSAMWFKDGEAKGGYFGLDGQSKQRSFLASPLEFSRVTSGFSMRMHPILNSWKQHNGVDYGAPVGTPVRTVGDGVVEFAGWQNGYGNVVHVRHSNERSTVYAHLEPGRRREGQKVDIGTIIGAGRPDRLGDRAAPPLRGEDRRVAAGPAPGRADFGGSRRRAGVEGALRPARPKRSRPARRRRDAAANAASRRIVALATAEIAPTGARTLRRLRTVTAGVRRRANDHRACSP
jgi:hypothetical protein